MWNAALFSVAGVILLVMGLRYGGDSHWSWWILALAASLLVAFLAVALAARVKDRFDWRYRRARRAVR